MGIDRLPMMVFTDPPWNVNYGAVDKGNAMGYKPRTILNDHMIPITRGGSMYNLNNLLALCKSCHDTKSVNEKTSIAPVTLLNQ